jgi:competence ComEA-like helix-hairpin-helix protein
MTRSAYVVGVSVGVLVLAVALRASATIGPAGGQQTTASGETPERALYVRVCAECHDLDRTETLRRTRSEWTDTIFQMIDEGAEASEEEFQTILEFLVANYGAVAVNYASADDLVAVLAISREEGDAIVAYRTAHGNFSNFDALTKVPGIDVGKLEQRKASLRFY